MIIVPDVCLPLLASHRTHYTGDIASEYGAELMQTFEGIEAYLPETADSILDIGCGMAGIDVFLGVQYPDATITLADKQGQSGRQKGGYHRDVKQFGYYHDFEAAIELLRANGVENNIKRHEIVSDIPRGRFDIVVSLLSWGFHYPISTYKLKSPKLIIADIRKDTDGKEALSEYGHVTVVHVGEKLERVVVEC